MGVVYTREFRGLPEDVIVDIVTSQGVTHVKKILKEYDELKKTGLYILTFETDILPEVLKIGFEIF